MLRTIGVSKDFCDDTFGVKRRMHQHLASRRKRSTVLAADSHKTDAEGHG